MIASRGSWRVVQRWRLRTLCCSRARLLGETEHPAGHRHRDSVGGKVEDQRVGHFGPTSRAKNAAAWRRISFSCSSNLLRLRSSRNSADSPGSHPGVAVFDVGQFQPAVQTRLADPEVLRDLGYRSLALTGDRDHVTAELGRNAFGTMNILPVKTKILTRQESTEPRAVPGVRSSSCGRTGTLVMLVGSVGDRDRVDFDEVAGFGQGLDPQQGVGGFVVTEHGDPGCGDVR